MRYERSARAQRAPKADEEALSIGADLQSLDVQSTLGLHVADRGRLSQERVLRRQRVFQALEYLRLGDAVPIDLKSDQALARLVLAALIVPGVGGNRVDKPGAVESDAFEVVELPEVAEKLEQPRTKRDGLIGPSRSIVSTLKGWLFSSSTTRKRPSGNCWMPEGS